MKNTITGNESTRDLHRIRRESTRNRRMQKAAELFREPVQPMKSEIIHFPLPEYPKTA